MVAGGKAAGEAAGGFLKKMVGKLIRPASKIVGKDTGKAVAKDAGTSVEKDLGKDIPKALEKDAGDRLPTKELEKPFKGENDPANPDRFFRPQTVHYMSKEEREARRLFARDGKLYRAEDGTLFDTSTAGTLHSGEGRAMFVMDEHGNLYASNEQIRGELHHSSFLGGEPVAGAGEVVIKDGKLELMSTKSGHYQPLDSHNENVLRELERQGIDISRVERRGWNG